MALWDAVGEPCAVRELASILATRFDLPSHQIEQGLQPALRDLVERGMVEVHQ